MLLLVALLLPVTVQADVIYEPFDNFYEQHRMDCTYVGRSYTAGGPNGDVTLYASPEDSKVEKTYLNDTVLYVSYTYEAANGILWACCDNWDDGVTGWVPMEYLELIYDGISFREEYADRIVPVERTLDTSDLEGKEIYFWEYPGSRDYIQISLSESHSPALVNSYTDENGCEWGQCAYYFGIKGYWINLNDPTAEYEALFPDMPEESVPAETESAATEQMDEIKPAGNGEKVVVTLAVAAVAVITAAMLVLLKKKQK